MRAGVCGVFVVSFGVRVGLCVCGSVISVRRGVMQVRELVVCVCAEFGMRALSNKRVCFVKMRCVVVYVFLVWYACSQLEYVPCV